MTTIKEIAAKSGFSPATVSRLLNNDPRLSVTSETKSKILKVANKLGYFKKNSNRVNNLKPEIALLYRVNGNEQLQDEYFSFLRGAIKKVAQEKEINLTLFTEVVDLINQSSIFQGFLGVGTAEISYKELEKLHKVLPNGVFIDINPAPELFDSVQPNLELTIQDAIKKLLEHGYTNLGYIGAESFTLDHQPQRDIREITFTEYCKTRKVKDPKVFAKGIVSVKNGYNLAKEVVDELGKDLPDAFVIASDTLSVGVLQYFNEVGIRVPKDTAVISINNSEVAKYISPPLTSYNIDQIALSNLAISTLLMRITNSDLPKIHVTMNTDLIVRKSFN
ncbi:MAG: LacI family DNA-binding transcriptional regulator [Lactobacillus sp.]|uniref:LacI family DNA-binding transcriptional regulator n=1 Tax=Lactobacillus sp. TaxID=1591 RepID=UPI0023C255FF|nr:LacI family DNA-binding transcriptional regulator [Lactobacillus sp.]MDE7049351.1 LacI family DNA-binding transcriptional regulator [Lactobacillus sp.]